jgi:hypothetical protein
MQFVMWWEGLSRTNIYIKMQLKQQFSTVFVLPGHNTLCTQKRTVDSTHSEVETRQIFSRRSRISLLVAAAYSAHTRTWIYFWGKAIKARVWPRRRCHLHLVCTCKWKSYILACAALRAERERLGARWDFLSRSKTCEVLLAFYYISISTLCMGMGDSPHTSGFTHLCSLASGAVFPFRLPKAF